MSNANNVLLSYRVESTYGVIPAGNPDLQDVRFTQESLKQATETVVSEELRADEQVPDLIRVGISTSGDLGFEFSYAAFDDWLLAVLKATAWSTVETYSASISFAAADNSINDAANQFVAEGFVANQWVRLKKATGANAWTENYAKIVSVAAGKIVLAGITLVNESALTVEVEMGAQIVNGTTFRSYTIERKYSDLSNDFAQYPGTVIDKLSMTIAAKTVTKGSFGVIGKKEVSATATFGDGANTAAPTNPIMNAVDNVVALLEANATFSANQLDFSVARNHRVREIIGLLGAESVGSGTMDVTGNLRANYASAAFFNKYLNNTTSSFAVIQRDDLGNAYVVEFVRAKFSDGSRVGGGKNTDVTAQVAFRAYMHPTEGITMRIARFAA